MIVLLLNPEIPIYQKVIVMDSTMCDRPCRYIDEDTLIESMDVLRTIDLSLSDISLR